MTVRILDIHYRKLKIKTIIGHRNICEKTKEITKYQKSEWKGKWNETFIIMT